MDERERWSICVEIINILTQRIIANGSSSIIYYGDLAEKIGHPSITARSIATFLGDISFFCQERSIPPLSAIVISKSDGLPGDGYFSTFVGHSKSSKEGMQKYKKQLSLIWPPQQWKTLRIELGLGI